MTSHADARAPGTRGDLELSGPPVPGSDAILGAEALAFVGLLERTFGARRRELLARRDELALRLDRGWRPDFLAETAPVRASTWRVAPAPRDLLRRVVEITGPVDRKMIINALGSGADVFMADFEDSNAPTWRNVVEGQQNLFDAVRRTIRYEAPETGKVYTLPEEPATLMVRPRGWHLPEAHVRLDGEPVSASLFDFGLYFFHNARELVARGSGPYFYLPKLESHLEARLWNDVFLFAQEVLGIPRGTIRATVLIETILAAFEMDEILHELREHSAGLNCGRWDYIFSFVKKLRADPSCVLPERGRVTMEQPFLRAYSQLLVRTCHARGAHAIGGMAAQIPIKNDPARNQAALEKVRADKRREARDGHDGTWVAHPGLIAVAREEFERVLTGDHQLSVARDDVRVTSADLLAVPRGPITEPGLRTNLEVGVRYLAAWLAGQGCVPIHDLMEDAATAEISRTQVWQWIRHGACLDDGRRIDAELAARLLAEELEAIRALEGAARFESVPFALAARIFERMFRAERLPDFLTLAAYDHLVEPDTARDTPRQPSIAT
jgi:malate synthase